MKELQEVALTLALVANPKCKVIGISVNTQHMSEASAIKYLESLEDEFEMPAVDPFRLGAGQLCDALEKI